MTFFQKNLKLAEQGCEDCIYTMVVDYARGDTNNDPPEYEADINKSLKFFKELLNRAENGNINAQYLIASTKSDQVFYAFLKNEFGDNVKTVQDAFEKYITSAAMNGNADGIFANACIKYGEPLPGEGHNMCTEWKNEVDHAAELGSTWACYKLHIMYVDFSLENQYNSIETDASNYYLELGANGNGLYASECQLYIARTYAEGDLYREKDIDKCLYWYQKSVQNGNLEAAVEINNYQRKNEPINNKKSGCYIATAVYGSYDCPQVWTLRRYRDDILSKTWYGRLFIHIYYAVSPTLVKWFGHSNGIKKFLKQKLDTMVEKLNSIGVSNKHYKDK